MSNKAKTAPAAVGFRVKSSWAAAVLLAGPLESPKVLDHRRVDLADPAVPESRQPYHAGTGALEENPAKVAQRIKVVERATIKSVPQLLKESREMGCVLRGAALVVGSLSAPERRRRSKRDQLGRISVLSAFHPTARMLFVMAHNRDADSARNLAEQE